MKPINFISIFAKHTSPKFQWEKTRFFKVNFRWRENEKLFQHPYFCQKITQKWAFLHYFGRFWGVLVSHETLTQKQIVPRETYIFDTILTPFIICFCPLLSFLSNPCVFGRFWARIYVDIWVFCYVFADFVAYLPLFNHQTPCKLFPLNTPTVFGWLLVYVLTRFKAF